MDAYGILSLVFGVLGILSSYWYVGMVLCAAGLVLGIVGMVESYMESKTSLFGALLSVFGAIASIFFIVSDIDTNSLVLNSSKFGGEKIETAKNYDFMRFHKEDGEIKNRENIEIPVVTREEQKQEKQEELNKNTEEPKENTYYQKRDENNTDILSEYDSEEDNEDSYIETEEDKTVAKEEQDENYPVYSYEETEYFPEEEEQNVNNDVNEYENKTSQNTLSYEDIMRNPDANKGKHCTVTGTVDQIIEGWFGLFSIFIVDENNNKWGCTYSYKDGEPRLIEGDYVTVYGECKGTDTTKTVLGQQITMPRIEIERIN